MKRLYAALPEISIFILALCIRLLYNLTVAHHYFANYDAALYNHIVYNIVAHHCFCIYPNQPELSRPPLWPLILSITYLLPPHPDPRLLDTGVQVFYGRLLYCCIGSCTCVLIYLLARELFGARIALVTGVIAAVYPGLFIYDGWLYSVSLFIFLLTAFIFSLYQLQQTAKRFWTFACGILLGLEALARPNGALLFGLLLLWSIVIILAKIIAWQTMVKSFLAIICIAAIIIAPWTYHNFEVSHTFVLVSNGEGEVLLGAYNDTVLRGTTGWWISPHNITRRPALPAMVLKNHETVGYTQEDDKIATDYALHWIRAHLSDIPRLLSYHWNSMWSSNTPDNNLPYKEHPDQFSSQVVEHLMFFMPPLIFLLATFGLLVTWQERKKKLLLVYFAIALFIAQNLVFYGSMRFRAPIEPLLVLLAGGTLWWLTSGEPGTLSNRNNSIPCRKRIYASTWYTAWKVKLKDMKNMTNQLRSVTRNTI